ncbi:putative bifunctional diguanylate cyclase/phosphodiesterase [Caenibacillus caldisaponilyticus]|uniref:putative bifunctional diguanylate cyclase/phosphodiesterase n=1 Tax=Caenibacillus caldisaponilyticus TaxID=1674942 RepID=UPI0009888634|nr:EAL domain-containing protein [Caenibacillus caldisaponilyticus]
MNTFQHLYTNFDAFKRFLAEHGIGRDNWLFIQLLRHPELSQTIIDLQREIDAYLPHAHVFEGVGASWFGSPLDKNEIRMLVTVVDDAAVSKLLNQVKTARREHELAARYEAVFNGSPNCSFSLDESGRLLSVNPAVTEQLDYKEKELVGRPGTCFVEDARRAACHRHFLRALDGQTRTFDLNLVHKNGASLPFKVTLIPIRLDGRIIGVHGIAVNRTEQKQAESMIERLAYHDAMTGLPNRALFEKSLNYLVGHAERNGERLAVIFVDIDRFKNINDTVGHFVGDQILKLAVERIQSRLLASQLLARFEGDKFSIIVPHIKSKRSVVHLVERLQRAFDDPIVYNGAEYFLTVCMGISFFPTDGKNEETLMKNADIALYVAKMQGDNTFRYYEEGMKEKFSGRIELEGHLRRALAKDEFVLYYQPQVDIRTETVVGCEALIRWRHPKLGIVPPDQFIPIAEEIGLIEDIGLWVLRSACRQIKRWQEKGFKPIPVSVNVSMNQFIKKDFVKQVRRIIQQEGVDPKYIHMEITESTTLHDIQYSNALVNELKRIGVRVSLDDFGTGYSALSYLKDFSIDTLKIDRSFIRNLTADSRDSAIVQAIITMCQGLSLKTVAEGVETAEQLHLLRDYGCHVAQGFYYSRPVPVEDFESFIKKNKVS